MAVINGLILKMAVSDAVRQVDKTLPLSLCTEFSQLHLPLKHFIVWFELNKRKSIPKSTQLKNKDRYQVVSLKRSRIVVTASSRINLRIGRTISGQKDVNQRVGTKQGCCKRLLTNPKPPVRCENSSIYLSQQAERERIWTRRFSCAAKKSKLSLRSCSDTETSESNLEGAIQRTTKIGGAEWFGATRSVSIAMDLTLSNSISII